MIAFIKKLPCLHKASILAASETSPDDSAEVIYYRTRAAFPTRRGMDKNFDLFYCQSAVPYDIAQKSVPLVMSF